MIRLDVSRNRLLQAPGRANSKAFNDRLMDVTCVFQFYVPAITSELYLIVNLVKTFFNLKYFQLNNIHWILLAVSRSQIFFTSEKFTVNIVWPRFSSFFHFFIFDISKYELFPNKCTLRIVKNFKIRYGELIFKLSFKYS